MFGNKDKYEAAKARESIERMKLIRTFLIIIIALVIVIGILITIIVVSSKIKKSSEEEKPALSGSTINQQIANCSNLTTAELTYNGLVRFSKGSIPFIDLNSFSMIYTATARAGIDVKEAQTTVTDTEIIISLPPCDIQEIIVDPASLEFFDEKKSIFNPSEKTDAVTAIQYAEDDVKEKADLDSLKDRATTQTETIIKGIVEPISEGRIITIKYKDDAQ